MQTINFQIFLTLTTLNIRGTTFAYSYSDQCKGSKSFCSNISSCTSKGSKALSQCCSIFALDNCICFYHYKESLNQNKERIISTVCALHFIRCSFLVIFWYINNMQKSLLLKCSSSVSIDFDKHRILTVPEVLKKFEIKSPAQKTIILPSKTSSDKKVSICSPRNATISMIKLPSAFEIPSKSIELDKVPTNKNGQQSRINSKASSMTRQQLFCKKVKEDLKPINKTPGLYVKPKESQTKRQMNRQRTVANIMREINKISLSEVCEQKVKIPRLKITPKEKYIKPPAFSDRVNRTTQTQNAYKGPRIATSTRNIKLHNKREEDTLSVKTCKNAQTDNFFRKGSSASTLSLKTRHNFSDHLEDSEELFIRESRRKLKSNCKEYGVDPCLALAQVKNKIYQQINSLDSKLFVKEAEEQSKPVKVICLKRKKEKIFEETTIAKDPINQSPKPLKYF